MMFSIITPTLQRESLIRCCQSVDLQTFKDYEHIVWIDSDEINCELFKSIQDDKRFIYSSKRKHGHYGNHARNCAWKAAKGNYVIWLDDDNWCDDVVIIPEMLALGIDVVSAPYTNKRQPQRWVHQHLPAQGINRHLAAGPPPRDELLEVAGR